MEIGPKGLISWWHTLILSLCMIIIRIANGKCDRGRHVGSMSCLQCRSPGRAPAARAAMCGFIVASLAAHVVRYSRPIMHAACLHISLLLISLRSFQTDCNRFPRYLLNFYSTLPIISSSEKSCRHRYKGIG